MWPSMQGVQRTLISNSCGGWLCGEAPPEDGWFPILASPLADSLQHCRPTRPQPGPPRAASLPRPALAPRRKVGRNHREIAGILVRLAATSMFACTCIGTQNEGLLLFFLRESPPGQKGADAP